jgi:hypothetical protein
MSYSYKTAAPLKPLNVPKPAKDLPEDTTPEGVAEDLLPGNLRGGLADVLPAGPWGNYRRGKAQSIANAMGYEAPFAVQRPGINMLLNSGVGGLLGAGLGAGAGAGLGALLGGSASEALKGGVGFGAAGLGLGAWGGLGKGILDSRRGIGDVKRQLIEHLRNKEKLNPIRPNLTQALTGSGSMDAGQADAYVAMKRGKKIKPRTVLGSLGETVGVVGGHTGFPTAGLLPSLQNRLHAHNSLREDDAMQEKTSAFLYKLAVKQASLLTLDSFLTKVAAALPMAKRAAFRTMQAELSSGNTLSHAIKVAFPRLTGEQRGALAVNFCKCAADAAKNTRTFESYAVPVKEGNKLMREKCSEEFPFDRMPSDLDNAPKPPSAPKLPADTFGLEQIYNPMAGLNASLSKVKAPAFMPGATPPESAAPAAAPGKFDLSSLLSQAGTYAKDPRVLGGLAAGGLGAYGLSRLMRRKKPRPGAM